MCFVGYRTGGGRLQFVVFYVIHVCRCRILYSLLNLHCLVLRTIFLRGLLLEQKCGRALTFCLFCIRFHNGLICCIYCKVFHRLGKLLCACCDKLCCHDLSGRTTRRLHFVVDYHGAGLVTVGLLE